MMKQLLTLLCCLLAAEGMGQTAFLQSRALWASINGAKNASLDDYQQHTGKVLVTWRMLPGDNAATGFDLYRTVGTGVEKKIAANILNRTCFQDGTASSAADNRYRPDVRGQRRDTRYLYTHQSSGQRRSALYQHPAGRHEGCV